MPHRSPTACAHCARRAVTRRWTRFLGGCHAAPATSAVPGLHRILDWRSLGVVHFAPRELHLYGGVPYRCNPRPAARAVTPPFVARWIGLAARGLARPNGSS